MILDQPFLDILKSSYIHFDLTIKDGQMGAKRSKAKGSSVEFSDFREYTLGDDFRRIDWNAYARFEKLFIKLFLEEREARINLFIDSSASMGFYEKEQAFKKVAAAFSYYALAGYDSVSLYDMNPNSTVYLKGLKGKNSFYRIVNYLETLKVNDAVEPLKTLTKYQNQLQRGMSVIISDFLGEYDLETVLKLLKFKKQEVYVIHILSDEELRPNFEEHVRLIDSENGHHLELMAGSEMLRIYEKALKKHMNHINGLCKKYQSHYLSYNADMPFDLFLKELTGVVL